MEKEGKPNGKNPTPKKRDEKGCMDGWSNQDPHPDYNWHQLYKIVKNEKEKSP